MARGTTLPPEAYRRVVAERRGSFRRPSKYGNVPIEVDLPTHGRVRCESKREAELYRWLEARRAAGELRPPWYLIQVPIPLGADGETGKRLTMRVDALVFPEGGGEEWLDAKGPKPTRDWALKRAIVRARLGIEVATW